jgi:hypothetical protein
MSTTTSACPSGQTLQNGQCVTIQPTQTTPQRSCLGWWAGEGNANDATGTRNGIVSNVGFAPGRNGNAFIFDGSSGYVRLSGTFGGGPEATISAWIKTNSNTPAFQAIVSSIGDPECVHLQISGYQGSTVKVSGTVGSAFIPSPVPTPIDTWRHIVLSIKNGDTKLYENGVLIGQDTVALGSVIPTSNLLIGNGYQYSRTFSGLIDDVKIFNRSFSSSELSLIDSDMCSTLAQ